MNDFAEPPDVSASIRRGKAWVAAAIVLNCAMGIGVIVLAIVMNRDDQIFRQVLKFAGNVGAMFGLWYGSLWMRWLYALGFTLLALLFAVVPIIAPGRVPGYVAVPAVVVGTVGTWAFAFSKPVDDFFRWRRGDIEFEEPVDQIGHGS